MHTCLTNTNRSPVREAIPVEVLNSVLLAQNQRELSRAVDQFADAFAFNDHALGLDFSDKDRLIQFFQKLYELFPDTAVEVVSSYECGDHAIAEWKLTATTNETYGTLKYRYPILLRGSTIARVRDGRVTHWSDYYDQLTSRRYGLVDYFKEWVEY